MQALASLFMKRMLQHLMFFVVLAHFWLLSHFFQGNWHVLYESVVYWQMAVVTDLDLLKPLNLVEFT